MKKLLLISIVLLAACLRFVYIDKVPVSLYWDEASATYNAYSILKTGKDEFGTVMPLLFRAFEDYKAPFNIYLTVLPVFLFGVNEFSARFTSAFLGTLTVGVAYFFTRDLLRQLRRKNSQQLLSLSDATIENIALLVAFFLAISPWHINFSRTGFEANVGLFFSLVGVWMFVRGLTKEYWNMVLAAICFGVTVYCYRSYQIFTPLLLIVLLGIFHKELLAHLGIKKIIGFGLLVFLVVLPFLPWVLSKEGFERARQVNVFENSQEQVYESAKKRLDHPGLLGSIIYNRRITYGEVVVQGYLSHFDPKFLFFQGDGNKRHGVEQMGVLYRWEILFVIFGVFIAFKINKRLGFLTVLWILIAPVAASFSVPTPHSLRTLTMLPIPQLLCALGVVGVWMIIPKKWGRYLFIVLLSIIIGYSCVTYLSRYFTTHAQASSTDWADGYKQLVAAVQKREKNFDKVIISGHYWQPYVYFLFYTSYDPLKFQQSGKKSEFGHYIFGGTSWDRGGVELGTISLAKRAGTSNYLVALAPEEYYSQKDNVKILERIYNHNGELIFILATSR